MRNYASWRLRDTCTWLYMMTVSVSVKLCERFVLVMVSWLEMLHWSNRTGGRSTLLTCACQIQCTNEDRKCFFSFFLFLKSFPILSHTVSIHTWPPCRRLLATAALVVGYMTVLRTGLLWISCRGRRRRVHFVNSIWTDPFIHWLCWRILSTSVTWKQVGHILFTAACPGQWHASY